jgi:hypothetical protein
MGTTASNLKTSVLRFVYADHTTAGTGFVVTEHLAVTCAHVVTDAGSAPGQSIQIQIFGTSATSEALVLSMGWSPVEEDDVAFVQIPSLPANVAPVVLGSTELCSGHGYTAFGYAPSGRSPTQPAIGTLHDVVTVEEAGCHPLLQLDGNLVEKGLSGSPVFDVITQRVVGMVNSFQNTQFARIAWATTTETLVALIQQHDPSAFSLWPDAYGPDERQAYLEEVIRLYHVLRLPLANLPDVPLERLYISLRADEMNREERQAERFSLDAVLERGLRAHDTTDPYMRHARMLKQVTRTPTMFMHEARDWPRIFGERESKPMTVAELVQHHAQAVVLGDPGSGKTTIGKWLVLQHARAASRGVPSVTVAADQVQPGSTEPLPIDLGRTRLPIFLSMATLSMLDTTHLLETIQTYDCASGKAAVKLSPAFQALRRDALFQGNALVVLDGLDEIQNELDRRDIMQDIHRFLHDPPSEAVARWQDNQVVLTSRIVGYQYAPLIDLPHYIVEGMDEQAIGAFCQAWMRQFAEVDPEAVEQQARRLQDAIFDYAHPGVRLLASNPLLLTILAQVYWEEPEHRLPPTRVALFKQATQALFRQRKAFWQQARITEQHLEQALGQVAFDIQSETALGLVVGGTVRASLLQVFTDPGLVEGVLEAAREIAGFLVEKGEGIYGFLHRSLQEYFVALYFTARPSEIHVRMHPYLWNPAWREPLILAAGIVGDPNHVAHAQFREVLRLFLDTPDPLGEILPRGALLVAAASAECEAFPEDIGARGAEHLLTFSAEREGRGKSPVLWRRIEQAFWMLERSSAKKVVEQVLCRAVQQEEFECRYAAIDLVFSQCRYSAIDMEISQCWQSPALVNALLASWRRYAAPAGPLLKALFTIRQRRPAFFEQALLPMRHLMQQEPQLWEKITGHPTWQAIIRALYLLPSETHLSPASVYLDSPLTARIEAMVRQQVEVGSPAFALFQEEMRSFTLQPGTPQARDAALVLCVLDDASWIDPCLTLNGELIQILPIAARLAFAYGHDRARFFAHNIAHDLDIALDLTDLIAVDFDFIRIIALARDLARSFARDLDRDLDRDLVRDSSTRARTREIQSLLQSARQHWEHEAIIIQYLESALRSLQRFEVEVPCAEYPGYELYQRFLQACYERWPSSRQQNEGHTSPLPPAPLTQERVALLVTQLASGDDAEREQARRTLLDKTQNASALGHQVIEQLARQARTHATEPFVGTLLMWALHQVVYDVPALVSAWIEQRQREQDQEHSLAETILSNLHRVTPETFASLLDSLPHVSKQVNVTLLGALSWQLRRERIPDGWHERLQSRLLSWLKQEELPEVRVAMLKTLGHWRGSQSANIVHALLKRSKDSMSHEEMTALLTALARLASQETSLASQIWETLLSMHAQPSSGAALARFAVACTRKEHSWSRSDVACQVLEKLRSHGPDLMSCLAALLDAGTDDDPWEEDYHGVLVLAAQQYIKHAHAPGLLALLLNRLKQALEQGKWPMRRMMLATLAACAETMPKTLLDEAHQVLLAEETLEHLLVQGAVDAESYSSRRFALTILSYLGAVTTEVAPALLAGSRDIAIVQQAALDAAGRFKAIEGDLLTPLIEALGKTLRDEHGSMATAYSLVRLLAALGTSTVRITPEQHQRITAALTDALTLPQSQRTVRLATGFASGEDKGSLADTIYTALLQLTEGSI